MGVPILIVGKSGTGKSSSLKTLDPDGYTLINVLGKPLPFKGRKSFLVSTDYKEIALALKGSQTETIVIDDAGYLITDMFMMRHADAGKGNGVFSLYNDIADNFYKLIRFISRDLPEERLVFLMLHEDTDDLGNSKIKTIGKLLDEKVTVEGMVSIVLRSTNTDGNYTFQTNGPGIWKSPSGMFDDEFVPNDLALVEKAVRDYWGLEADTPRESEDS